jgi:hypothetical protein
MGADKSRKHHGSAAPAGQRLCRQIVVALCVFSTLSIATTGLDSLQFSSSAEARPGGMRPHHFPAHGGGFGGPGHGGFGGPGHGGFGRPAHQPVHHYPADRPGYNHPGHYPVHRRPVVAAPRRAVVVAPIRPIPTVRPWYWGSVVAGVTIGTIIAVSVAKTVPPAPSPELCWYWTSASKTKGYWSYCTAPAAPM